MKDVKYLILAAKDKYDLKYDTTFVTENTENVEKDFVMTMNINKDKGVVAGQILNNIGQEMVGVTVKLYDNSTETPLFIKQTYSNEYGKYVFFDVPQGIYILENSMLGYKTIRTNFVLDAKNIVVNINLSMQSDYEMRKGTINGAIKDIDGNPISDASVILFKVEVDKEGKEKLIPVSKTITDSNGLYLFEMK